MLKQTSVAVDTNVILDRAEEDSNIIDCLDTIRSRLPNPKIIVLPTVILELTDIAMTDPHPACKMARVALERMIDPWKFQPVNCIPVGHGVVESIGTKIREKGLIPDDEVHDAFVVAEAALYGAAMLISNDSHIKEIDWNALKILLESCDVGCPLIASPWKIVHTFFK